MVPAATEGATVATRDLPVAVAARDLLMPAAELVGRPVVG